jgi:hypothetical protein
LQTTRAQPAKTINLPGEMTGDCHVPSARFLESGTGLLDARSFSFEEVNRGLGCIG